MEDLSKNFIAVVSGKIFYLPAIVIFFDDLL